MRFVEYSADSELAPFPPFISNPIYDRAFPLLCPLAMDHPNILFVFTDQQRWDTCGLHGNPLDLTPNFDAMAREGAHLRNCFTPQPVCGPARACLQTGRYATRAGSWRNGIPLSTELPTLAGILSSAGYETGYIGKWHLASSQAVEEKERGGYQSWLAANASEACSRPYRTVLFDERGNETFLPGYRVDAYTDAAIRFLERPRDKPFFLFLSYLEPHHQNNIDAYPAPEGYRGRYTGRWTPPDLQALTGTAPRDLGGYYGIVKRIDECLGRLRDALRSLELLENTIVVFTSDHGCHFKTRNAEYKRSCHDASLRVPGAIAGPGFEGGGERRELFSLIDFAPTLLDAAGIAPPETMDGSSLLPQINRTAKAPWRDSLFFQVSESEIGRGIRTERWKYAVTAPNADPWTESRSEEYEEAYLYDLQEDPYELTNLIGFTPLRGVASVLKRNLENRIASIEDRRPRIRDAQPVEDFYIRGRKPDEESLPRDESDQA